MLSKLAVRRLTKLADFMDALPAKARKHFGMELFFDHDGEQVVSDPVKALRRFDCGTSACALGWAATIPEFRKAGLVDIENITVEQADKCFDDEEAWTNLFSPELKIKTPKQWARHCRRYIRENT